MNKRLLQAPKGTRDFAPGTLFVRQKVLDIIRGTFELYGFEEWDGPVFENFEILSQKSGAEIRSQIYNFTDKGGRELGLRFDLTVSLGRIIASNPNIKKPIKAFNTGKVYRYENTQAGRYREFLQTDADVFGDSSVEGEIEILSIVKDVFGKLSLPFKIIVNDRELLQILITVLGVPVEKSSDALRILDKVNKVSEADFVNEFLGLGISKEVSVSLRNIGRNENGDTLRVVKELVSQNERAVQILDRLEYVCDRLKQTGADIDLNFSLVRGQDYYTGIIYEYVVQNDMGIGSVGGGGRYDGMIELFGGAPTPALGISFGIDRIIDIIESDEKYYGNLRGTNRCFVAYDEEQKLPLAVAVCNELRQNGISASMIYEFRKYDKQFNYAVDKNFDIFITVKNNKEIKVKELATREEYVCSIDAYTKKYKEGNNDKKL